MGNTKSTATSTRVKMTAKIQINQLLSSRSGNTGAKASVWLLEKRAGTTLDKLHTKMMIQLVEMTFESTLPIHLLALLLMDIRSKYHALYCQHLRFRHNGNSGRERRMKIRLRNLLKMAKVGNAKENTEKADDGKVISMKE